LIVRCAVLVLSLASVIGIGGTMMTEIDYSANFFLQAVGLEHTNNSVRMSTQVSILLFTTLYVLWGGFKATVFTDRFQVPVAYFGLGIFTVGLSIYTLQITGGIAVIYLLGALILIYFAVLSLRLRALADSTDPWARSTAYLTFGSLIFVTTGALLYYSWPYDQKSFASLLGLLHPEFPTEFVIWGGISLLTTNLLWQLIDITALQRLQAIDKRDIQKSRANIAGVIIKTGIEAGLGWILIVICALVVKLALAGIKDPNDLILRLLQVPGWVPYLVPIFILTVVVFMLSTISGFISAVAYIAHFDIASNLRLYDPNAQPRTGDEISITRLVTLVCVLLIYGLYTLLRTTSRGDISTILYAIWAFQLAIAPSVLGALFGRTLINPWIVVFSTLAGLATSWYVATHPSATLFGIMISEDAWAMLPPLAVIIVSCVTFLAGRMLMSGPLREQPN
jgi:hypothetical protein